MPDRGSLAVESTVCLPKEILTSRFSIAPQNDRVGISTTHIDPNRILRVAQNDRTMEIVSKEPPTQFFVKSG